MLDHSRSNPDQLIEEIRRLQDAELETLLERVWLMHAERSAPHLNATETALLSRINQSLPADDQAYISVLNEKMQNDVLLESERLELLALHQKAETLQAHRLEAVVELAKVRGLTPKQMLEKLGLAA
jgi:hypothetical protein